jgi:hypothetical protein
VLFLDRIRRTISWGELDYQSPRINFNGDLCTEIETGLLLEPTAGQSDTGVSLRGYMNLQLPDWAMYEFRGSALRRGRRGWQRKPDAGSQIVEREEFLILFRWVEREIVYVVV